MILEKIRAAFPETTRTEEQDLLIGSTCLALTDQERDTIENLNFTRYESSLDKDKRKELSLKVAESVANAQWWGKVSGFTTGGVSSGAAAWYLAALSPLWIEPVRAEDGYVYEKAAIIEHLIHWTDRAVETLALRQIQERAPLSPQEAQELLNTRSPFRNADITIERLKPLPGYYKETVKTLTFKYNMEVLKQRAIVDQSKKQTQDLPEETAKVMKFYSMTQEKRNHIKADMRRDLLVHGAFRLDEEKEEDEALEFLKAAAKPPELINYRV